MRKAEYSNYIYFISDDGSQIFDSKGRVRKIQTNKHRQNRKHLGLNGKDVFYPILVANAFPEICGELFDGCEVHHIDGNTCNNNPENLIVLTKEEHLKIHKGLIVQYTLNGVKIGVYKNSYEAAEAINNKVTSSAIRDCLSGKSKTCGGYLWKREY